MRKATCFEVLPSKYFRVTLILFLLIPQISLAYSTDYRFTGKPLDVESDLYYFNSRAYNPESAKFIQPDPLANYLVTPQLEATTGMKLEEILANPQRFNYYSYSLNNPVNVVDPTGESPIVSAARRERFNEISNYIRNDDSYWLVRDRDGNTAAVDLLWQKSIELSKNDKGKVNVGRALDTFYDAVNINWRDDKTLDQNRDDYLVRLRNLPNALDGQYGGDLSQIDKLQHFAASARMAYQYGGKVAMLMGRLKEAKDGLRAIFDRRGYANLAGQDEGYSQADILANQQGVFWLNEFLRSRVNPAAVINNW